MLPSAARSRSDSCGPQPELSLARAEAVAELFGTKLAEPDRIEVKGKGEDQPVADNATPEGRALNRRVEMLIPRER